ncbi:hypothetical protein ACFQOY_12110 [Enterococcus alcedinis]|uniref:Uncharacterized protein n=1 Tax=Enterococcus alcedinis TaxID=1274384 RepID=A0A917JFL5_9ENTE|nr:hypothetical protein [Enterococcus alcedinis]MBP2102496.1 hypothetical protein [Enterococcus alcedinis]GGI65968.1 hypothetical protein GCM10011482_16220 [Enterococcus alcedinis]
MNYSVVAVTYDKEKKEKQFKTYREALSYATNYHVVHQSQVLKDEVVIADFSF